MDGKSGFRVFISSTSEDLRETRDGLGRYFKGLGAVVSIQEQYPDTLNDGFAIKSAIDSADLNICLVGHCFGGELHSTPPGENIPADVSWTQWELLYALERYIRERPDAAAGRPELLVCFAGDRLKKSSESAALQARQQAFREQVAERLIDQFGAVFFRTFDSPASLFEQVRHTVEGSNGLIDALLDRRWETFKAAYVAFRAADWEEEFPDGEVLSKYGADDTAWLAEGSPLFGLEKPVLVDTQRFALIEPPPNGRQLAQLADWQHAKIRNLGFDDLKGAFTGDEAAAKLLSPPRPASHDGGLRLALVTVAGIGKTTTMRRLQYEINRSGQKLAVLLDAIDFRGTEDDSTANLQRIIQRVVKALGLDWTLFGLSAQPDEREKADLAGTRLLSPVALLSHGIDKAARDGRLVIMIDGLDHVDTMPPALVRLQSEALWARTDVVVSGRPQPFAQWDETEGRRTTPDARFWRFAVPLEVTESEAKAYLGGIDGGGINAWRYDLVRRNLGSLLYVPRVLELVRTLDPADLASARTASDIYYRAVRHLLQQGLSSTEGGKAPEARVGHFLRLISALAFESMFSGASGVRSDHAAPLPIGVDEVDADDNGDPLFGRIGRFYAAPDDSDGRKARAAIREDLHALARLSTLVNNGLLDNERGLAETLHSVLWVNRTMQHFLAAYWLAAHAPGDLASHAGGLDSDWFRAALFSPQAPDSDATEEMNRFLAEMPAAAIRPASWLCAARAWYDPALVRGEGSPGVWSTEMIARSWRTMHALADRRVEDWWDISYAQLSRLPPGQRWRADLHAVPSMRRDDRIIAAARAALDGFLGDFAHQLAASPPGSPARSFAAGDWRPIPAGTLDPMGSPEAQQGFPDRTLAYWQQQIRRAIDAPDLAALARSTSPDSWWSGPYGARQREEEVAWLVDKVFRPYAEAARQGPEVMARAEPKVLDALRDNFRRADETPDEPVQPVAAFELDALPVTNAVFALFSPGHVRAVTPVLESNQQSQHGDGKRDESQGDHTSADWAAPERPAIYISWFDAWAFAQWARWELDGVRYACRLPHEPEWEYACKQMPGPDGRPLPSPFGQLYWWGANFYLRPSDPAEENRTIPEAHAVGWPGATRPPANAAPNGFGLRDMIGNTWEWCAHAYDLRSEAEIKEDRKATGYSRHRPSGQPPRNNAPRSMRGGIWYYMNHIATASSRFRLEPADADYKTGFRLVRERRGDERGRMAIAGAPASAPVP